jgi:Tfp pilus assembly protein PilP
MLKPSFSKLFFLALAMAALLGFAAGRAPAQNGQQAAAPSAAQEPSTRPLDLPGPAPDSAPEDDSESPTGETDPTVIERVRLDELSLSAIVVANNPDNNIAMVEHQGVGYLVQKGARIGIGNGVVREITASSVIVEQPAAEPSSSASVVTLSLPKK